jgi:catechol 2,3-dioxygenase-like lactoylglutathione lyase family enzyme
MDEKIDGLLRQYETGQLTRRQFVVAISALLAVPASLAAPGPIGRVEQLNHVTLFVRDVRKSVQFYQELLGMPVLTEQSPGMNLQAGTGFVGIYPSPRPAAGSINHFCLGMKNFDADTVLKQLTDRGLKARIRLRGDTKELYFEDPDNIRVQLQDIKYKGGTGPLGDL